MWSLLEALQKIETPSLTSFKLILSDSTQLSDEFLRDLAKCIQKKGHKLEKLTIKLQNSSKNKNFSHNSIKSFCKSFRYLTNI